MHAHKTRDVNYDIENIKLVGWGMRVKMCNFRMSSNISCRLKIDCYKYNILCKAYSNLKAEIYIRHKKLKRKSSKHTTTENHQITEKESKRRKAQRNY